MCAVNRAAFGRVGTIVAVDGICSASIQNEVVLLAPESGTYFSVNNLGAQILQQMSHPISIEALVENVSNRYEISYERVLSDVEAFVDQLVRQQLAKWVDTKAPT